MNKYNIKFHGRLSGAIGITYDITKEYEAENLGKALYKLWSQYEHIRIIEAKENGKKLDLNTVGNTKLIKS